MLTDSKNINIFLREGGESVGYLLVKPFKTVVLELKEYDPGLTEESDKFYIETIQILPANQGRGGARRLLIEACKSVLKRGVSKFAIHARTNNGLNEKIKRVFEGSIILSRKIESWKWAEGEPYEYIEWKYRPSEEM
jgi:ribosomal protein S18 acetylase RimI-like enzyme